MVDRNKVLQLLKLKSSAKLYISPTTQRKKVACVVEFKHRDFDYLSSLPTIVLFRNHFASR